MVVRGLEGALVFLFARALGIGTGGGFIAALPFWMAVGTCGTGGASVSIELLEDKLSALPALRRRLARLCGAPMLSAGKTSIVSRLLERLSVRLAARDCIVSSLWAL